MVKVITFSSDNTSFDSTVVSIWMVKVITRKNVFATIRLQYAIDDLYQNTVFLLKIQHENNNIALASLNF